MVLGSVPEREEKYTPTLPSLSLIVFRENFLDLQIHITNRQDRSKIGQEVLGRGGVSVGRWNIHWRVVAWESRLDEPTIPLVLFYVEGRLVLTFWGVVWGVVVVVHQRLSEAGEVVNLIVYIVVVEGG